MLSDAPYYKYYKLPGNRRSYFLLNKSSCIIYDPFTEHDEPNPQAISTICFNFVLLALVVIRTCFHYNLQITAERYKNECSTVNC